MDLGINPSLALEWVQDVLWHKEETILPPKTHLDLNDGVFYNVMPCVLKKQGVMGVKVVTRQPGRVGADQPALTSQILLYDLDGGKLLAVMDAGYITAMRTGAVAAHSMALFAKKGFATVGVMGLGITGTATMDIFLSANENRTMRICVLRYKDQAERFIARYSKYSNIEFCIVDRIEDICSCDVVLSCVTYQKDPFVADACFKKGCTIVPVHTRGFQNCDLFFEKVFCDDHGHVKDFQYYDRFRYKLNEVADVVKSRRPGRENDEERIVVYNIGLSIHDIYFAKKIYDLAADMPEIEFHQPNKKMWL